METWSSGACGAVGSLGAAKGGRGLRVPSSPAAGAATGFWPPKKPLTKSAMVAEERGDGGRKCGELGFWKSEGQSDVP